tara:strand:+ start:19 stop:1194 length:1176 start_codon:yes stop_codon:yes gene_type:complete
MVESLAHQNLKLQAKQLLISRGYVEEKIIVDKKYIQVTSHDQEHKFRVDVYASNGSEFAVECGNFPRWKRPLYEIYFGKEHVLHIPYPKSYSKYNLQDLKEGVLTKSQGTQFLINTYKKYIYDYFKDDPFYDFQEFTEETRDNFDIDNHRSYKEINPEYSDEEEVRGMDVWMNFPDSKTLFKSEYKDKLHWGMIYYTKNKVAVSVLFSGRKPCEQFLDLSEETHKRIFSALKNLNSKFFIMDGNSMWEKSSLPPLDKIRNDPIKCHELDWETYQKILENLDNLIRLQKAGQKVGPVLDLVKVFCTDEELPEIIEDLREIYEILLKSESKIDVISENIKKIEDWEWYISQTKEWNDLWSDYVDKFTDVQLKEFKRACRKLRSDPEYKSYIDS